jgi:hypothetical protein
MQNGVLATGVMFLRHARDRVLSGGLYHG